MTLRDYLSYFEDVVRPTGALFQLVPPDKIEWRPTDSSFTFGQQMAHIAGAIGVYAHGIVDGEWGFSSMRERFVLNRRTPSFVVEEALRLLNENLTDFTRLVGGLTEEQFDVEKIFAPQFGGPVPRWRVAMLATEHHINHKAELFMYLKLIGIRVNTGHLYRG